MAIRPAYVGGGQTTYTESATDPSEPEKQLSGVHMYECVEEGRHNVGMKDYLDEINVRGWTDGAELICARCVTNPSLQRAIAENCESGRCSFCCSLMSVAPLDIVVKEVADGLWAEYDDPVNGAAYDSAEGGYQTTNYNTDELLAQHDDITDRSTVLEAISARFGTRLWCHRDPYALALNEALALGWEAFCRAVKTSRRYTFLVPDPDEQLGAGELATHTIPGAVASAVVGANLTTVLLPGNRWWRVRVDSDGTSHSSATEIGTPPAEFAQDNRMTPKGIGAFYGAETEEGAIAEVGYATTGTLSIGQFELLSALEVADLRDPPPLPSLFDRQKRHLRGTITFLHSFMEAIRKESPPSDRHNLEYIPTQVITELLRYYGLPGMQIDGVLWRSAKNPDVDVCALFIDNSEIIDSNLRGPRPDSARMQLDVNTVYHQTLRRSRDGDARGRMSSAGWGLLSGLERLVHLHRRS